LGKKTPAHRKVVLPDDIRNQILNLMKKLGLVFGCIDMIVTPNDEYFFLEINPSIEWL
jgi:glutathione synthase/RimK-type ligase-like ATP-grasp enzyme